MKSIKKTHCVNRCKSFVFLIVDFLPLLCLGWFEVQTHLLNHHVKLLLGVRVVWIGPTVRQRKGQSAIRMLKFERKSERVLDCMQELCIKYGGNSCFPNSILLGVPKDFLIEERDRSKDIASHGDISSEK